MSDPVFTWQVCSINRSEQRKSQGVSFATHACIHSNSRWFAVYLCVSLVPTLCFFFPRSIFLPTKRIAESPPPSRLIATFLLTSVCVPNTTFHVESWHDTSLRSACCCCLTITLVKHLESVVTQRCWSPRNIRKTTRNRKSSGKNYAFPPKNARYQ